MAMHDHRSPLPRTTTPVHARISRLQENFTLIATSVSTTTKTEEGTETRKSRCTFLRY